MAAFQGILRQFVIIFLRIQLIESTLLLVEVIQHLLRLPALLPSVLLVSSPPGLPNWALFVHSLLAQLSPCYLISIFGCLYRCDVFLQWCAYGGIAWSGAFVPRVTLVASPLIRGQLRKAAERNVLLKANWWKL